MHMPGKAGILGRCGWARPEPPPTKRTPQNSAALHTPEQRKTSGKTLPRPPPTRNLQEEGWERPQDGAEQTKSTQESREELG